MVQLVQSIPTPGREAARLATGIEPIQRMLQRKERRKRLACRRMPIRDLTVWIINDRVGEFLAVQPDQHRSD